MLTREVDPRIVMFLDVLLEGKPPFDIFSVGCVFCDQRCTSLSVQFKGESSARFYGAFALMSVGSLRGKASHTKE